MIRKIVFAAMAIELPLLGNAMPTDREIKQARPVVESLIVDDLNALKLKTKEPVAVVMSLLSMIDKAETEGEKFLLLKSAFALSAHNGQYDLAAKVLERLKREITDLPPDMIVTMVDKEMKRVDPQKAPGVSVIYKEAYHKVRGQKRLAEAKAELKKKPNDKALMRNVADCYVSIGDWPKALQVYSRLGVEAAKYELDPDSSVGYDVLKAADYWWGYKAADDKPFKVHAAGLYNVAVEKGLASGLRREMALKRIENSKQLDVLQAQSREPATGSMANLAVTRRAKKTKPAVLDVKFKAGLVGYWSFDGNANDATKNRNNGILHNITQAEDRFGNANKAYRFGGSSYIEISHSDTLNMKRAITMTAWIKPQRLCRDWIVTMQKGDKWNCNYQFAIYMPRNRVCFSSAMELMVDTQIGLELNKWHHVALTYESGKRVCFYCDGVQIGNRKASRDLPPNNNSLVIGYDPFDCDEYFEGDMDDVRLFNRALSEKEIQELYKAEAPEE